MCSSDLCAARLTPSHSGSATRCSSSVFHRVVTALRCRRAGPEVLVAATTAYAELLLADVEASDHRAHGPMDHHFIVSLIRRTPPNSRLFLQNALSNFCGHQVRPGSKILCCYSAVCIYGRHHNYAP